MLAPLLFFLCNIPTVDLNSARHKFLLNGNIESIRKQRVGFISLLWFSLSAKFSLNFFYRMREESKWSREHELSVIYFDSCRDYAHLLLHQLQYNLEGGHPDHGAIYCIYALN
jgi:expansin (peptidoglycan-binding protein)